MVILSTVFAIVLVIAVVICLAVNLVGLPGNWIAIAFVATYAYLVPDEYTVDIGLSTIIAMAVLAALGEAVEFLAAALGASKAGGSKRGTVLALAGSLAGGVAGLFISLPVPIPVVSQVIGALVFASLGALVGAVLGERWKGRDLDESLKVGHAAFWGRLLGTLGKILFGCWMLVLVLAALFIK